MRHSLLWHFRKSVKPQLEVSLHVFFVVALLEPSPKLALALRRDDQYFGLRQVLLSYTLCVSQSCGHHWLGSNQVWVVQVALIHRLRSILSVLEEAPLWRAALTDELLDFLGAVVSVEVHVLAVHVVDSVSAVLLVVPVELVASLVRVEGVREVNLVLDALLCLHLWVSRGLEVLRPVLFVLPLV